MHMLSVIYIQIDASRKKNVNEQGGLTLGTVLNSLHFVLISAFRVTNFGNLKKNSSICTRLILQKAYTQRYKSNKQLLPKENNWCIRLQILQHTSRRLPILTSYVCRATNHTVPQASSEQVHGTHCYCPSQLPENMSNLSTHSLIKLTHTAVWRCNTRQHGVCIPQNIPHSLIYTIYDSNMILYYWYDITCVQ